MHEEFVKITKETADIINEAKNKQRIIAVGTTSVRALESFANENGFLDYGEKILISSYILHISLK